MTDRELLELAAKAVGYATDHPWNKMRMGMEPQVISLCIDGVRTAWNPLEHDDDALRLMVKLGISILPYPVYEQDGRHSVIAKQRRKSDLLREANPTEVMELYGSDPCAAYRRAITRAAAEIGAGRK